jgi:hypothetical protein
MFTYDAAIQKHNGYISKEDMVFLQEYAGILVYKAYIAVRKANPDISVVDANKLADALVARLIREA